MSIFSQVLHKIFGTKAKTPEPAMAGAQARPAAPAPQAATPAIFHPDLHDLARAAEQQGHVVTTDDPREAVRGADCVVTDTWVSMGDTDHDLRLEALEPYQVDEDLMGEANADAIFLHCLPAHRGEEVTDGVIDGPQSRVWDEAENRIHAQKSILAWCFGAI